jgi:GNAT superfamily N-acetyltransferase
VPDTAVVTTYLEMHSPDALTPCARPAPEYRLMRAEEPCGVFNRFLYTAVGADWQWTDRLPWSLEQWQENTGRAGMETWVAYVTGTPAGYFELYWDSETEETELQYFGLLPQFIGRGLGGALLADAVRRAWNVRPVVKRVWVHTCNLDGPQALANYTARGFTVYKTETEPQPGAK